MLRDSDRSLEPERHAARLILGDTTGEYSGTFRGCSEVEERSACQASSVVVLRFSEGRAPDTPPDIILSPRLSALDAHRRQAVRNVSSTVPRRSIFAPSRTSTTG